MHLSLYVNVCGGGIIELLSLFWTYPSSVFLKDLRILKPYAKVTGFRWVDVPSSSGKKEGKRDISC
jgi:hypothetical protein